jgi:nitroreductase
MDTPHAITGFLRSLRAVRRFSDAAIPDEVLLDVLEVARWTGSSKNSQPWHVIVVQDRARLNSLSTCGPYAGHLAGAQAAVVLVMQDGNQRFDEGQLTHNIMLAAWAHGVGSCIGSLYPEANSERARQLLEVPGRRWLHTAISLGYPADPSATRLSANRTGLSEVPIGRRDASELISWERFGTQRPAS